MDIKDTKNNVTSLVVLLAMNIPLCAINAKYFVSNPDALVTRDVTESLQFTELCNCWTGAEVTTDSEHNYEIVCTPEEIDSVAPLNQAYDINVTKGFINWFKFGFILSCTVIFSIALTGIGQQIGSKDIF